PAPLTIRDPHSFPTRRSSDLNQAEADKPTLADMAVAYGASVLGFDQTARDGKRKFQTYRQLLNDSVHYLRSVIDRDAEHARAYQDRKSTRLNSSHRTISYAVF